MRIHILALLAALLLAASAEARDLPDRPGCWRDKHGHVADCHGDSRCLVCTGDMAKRGRWHKWRKVTCSSPRTHKDWCKDLELSKQQIPIMEIPDASSPPPMRTAENADKPFITLDYQGPTGQWRIISTYDGTCPWASCNAKLTAEVVGTQSPVTYYGRLLSTGRLAIDLAPIEYVPECEPTRPWPVVSDE